LSASKLVPKQLNAKADGAKTVRRQSRRQNVGYTTLLLRLL